MLLPDAPCPATIDWHYHPMAFRRFTPHSQRMHQTIPLAKKFAFSLAPDQRLLSVYGLMDFMKCLLRTGMRVLWRGAKIPFSQLCDPSIFRAIPQQGIYKKCHSSNLTGVLNPGGLMASTEQVSWLRMASAVLPMITPDMPVRATAPTTKRSACNSATRGSSGRHCQRAYDSNSGSLQV